jgi:hypothetical protein
VKSNKARQTLIKRISDRDMLVNKIFDFDKRLTASVYRVIITNNDKRA